MIKYFTEFIGTFFLVLTIGLVVNTGAGLLAPLAIGGVLMVMVYAGGHISGAHYNPAVTLAVLIRGRITFAEAIPYIIAQVAAAIIAGYLVSYLLGDLMPAKGTATPDSLKALIAEILGTFALTWVVLNVATAKANANNSFYGIAIGFTVTAMAYALGSISGGAFNPAVAVGLSFMNMAVWSDIWIYLVGCFGGALLAAFTFKLVNADQK